MIDFEDLISRKRIRFELGESTLPKKYRDFCVEVIDDGRTEAGGVVDFDYKLED